MFRWWLIRWRLLRLWRGRQAVSELRQWCTRNGESWCDYRNRPWCSTQNGTFGICSLV